jgi:hypothetical protein
LVALVLGSLAHLPVHAAMPGPAGYGDPASNLHADLSVQATSDDECVEASRSGVPACSGDTILVQSAIPAPPSRGAGHGLRRRVAVPGGHHPAGLLQPPERHS